MTFSIKLIDYGMKKEIMEKLIKLLNMTTSNNDGEALNAIRFCNRILKEKKWLWNDLFKSIAEEAPTEYESDPEYELACNMTMPFGKYKYERLIDIAEKDSGYLLWILDNTDINYVLDRSIRIVLSI